MVLQSVFQSSASVPVTLCSPGARLPSGEPEKIKQQDTTAQPWLLIYSEARAVVKIGFLLILMTLSRLFTI